MKTRKSLFLAAAACGLATGTQAKASLADQAQAPSAALRAGGASTEPAQTVAVPAPETSSSAIEEVIVTAQKRSENVQSVPLSIVAVSAQRLEDTHVTDVTALTRVVPNLGFTQISQSAGIAIRVRGFGAASNAAIDPSVAPYIDGVYIPRPGVIVSNFLDVADVEVLRGPQGTLFGRNATVGALSIKSTLPTFNSLNGHLTAELGNYGDRRVEGAMNVPVSSDFALRVAFLGTNTDGFYHNRLDGKDYGAGDNAAVRLTSRWNITPHLNWIVRFDYAHSGGDGIRYNPVDVSSTTPAQLASFVSHFNGNPPQISADPTLTINQKFDNPRLDDNQGGISSDLSWDFAGGYTLRLIDSYRDWHNFQSDGDVIYTPLDLIDRQASFDSKSQSHELQLISPQGALLDGRLDFVAGFYYFNEDYKIKTVLDLGSQYCGLLFGAVPARLSSCLAAPASNATNDRFDQNAESYAGYVQANLALTPTLKITLGARESHDDKSGSFVELVNNPGAAALRGPENTQLAYEKSKPSYRAGVNWQVTSTVLAFFTYSTGYKSGGFNSSGGAAALGQSRIFNAESAEDEEFGIKSTWFARRLLINATLYNTDLANFQDRSYNGTTFIIRNSGNVRARGVELEGQARLFDHVAVDFGAAYLDSIFTSNPFAPNYPACTGAVGSCPLTQNLTGRPTTFAPKYQGNFGLEYTSDPFFGGFTASVRGDVNFYTKQFTENTDNPQSIIDGQALLASRLTVRSPDRSWTFAFFVENLTDERYFTIKFAQTLAGPLGGNIPSTGATIYRAFVGAPRTLGARVTKSF